MLQVINMYFWSNQLCIYMFFLWQVKVMINFSPSNIALYLATLISCVATVYIAKYDIVPSIFVFLPLAYYAHIILQLRLISDIEQYRSEIEKRSSKSPRVIKLFILHIIPL